MMFSLGLAGLALANTRKFITGPQASASSFTPSFTGSFK